MAKINIPFNNNNYNIDESSLASASSALKSHLSTVMNGSGATITLGGTTYNIDSTKLTAATNDLIAHLGTITGSGSKVVVGGTEYAINSAKLSGAIAEIETVLGGLLSGGSGDEGSSIRFGEKYSGYDSDGAKTSVIFYEDGSNEVYISDVLLMTNPAGSATYEGLEVFVHGELYGTLNADGTEITVANNGNVFVLEPAGGDILDNTWPIEYNTKAINDNGNTMFNFDGSDFIRISALIPTADELQQKVVNAVSSTASCVDISTVMGCLVATYQAGSLGLVIVVVPTETELAGQFVPAGIYAVNVQPEASIDISFGDAQFSAIEIFPFQTVSGFEDYTFIYPFAQGLVGLEPAPFDLTVGETYFVEWDGVTYECVAKAADPSIGGYDKYIGAVNDMPELGMTGNAEPFCIAHGVQSDSIDMICTNSTATEHTVRICQKSTAVVGDILDDTQPIEWNTKTVSENNSSFTLSGIQYVKVSNLVLTDDELKTKTFSVARENGTVLNVSSVITGQINGWPTLTSRTAAYQCSILVVPEASELDGASISAGTYAKDMYASKGTEDTISVIDKA